MALSDKAVRHLAQGLADKDVGNEIATAVNNASAVVALSNLACVGAIVATNVSTTIDFGILQAGDKVAQIPATPGSAAFLAVATAGTLPAAAVVGDLYVVLRAVTLPTATSFKF